MKHRGINSTHTIFVEIISLAPRSKQSTRTVCFENVYLCFSVERAVNRSAYHFNILNNVWHFLDRALRIFIEPSVNFLKLSIYDTTDCSLSPNVTHVVSSVYAVCPSPPVHPLKS